MADVTKIDEATFESLKNIVLTSEDPDARRTALDIIVSYYPSSLPYLQEILTGSPLQEIREVAFQTLVGGTKPGPKISQMPQTTKAQAGSIKNTGLNKPREPYYTPYWMATEEEQAKIPQPRMTVENAIEFIMSPIAELAASVVLLFYPVIKTISLGFYWIVPLVRAVENQL